MKRNDGVLKKTPFKWVGFELHSICHLFS